MSELTRRKVLRRSAVAGGAALGAAVPAAGLAQAAAPARADAARTASAAPAAVTVRPDDIRYPELIRGTNQRWVGSPDYVRLASSTDQVVDAVKEAVAAGKRISVRSGGHCYADFISTRRPGPHRPLQLTPVIRRRRGAFEVEPGAWLPPLRLPVQGLGRHPPRRLVLLGRGRRPHRRRRLRHAVPAAGLTVDHLYAVEVVRSTGGEGPQRGRHACRRRPPATCGGRTPAAGAATSASSPGTWFRTPGATGSDPSALLPRPPKEVLTSTVTWSWDGLTQTGFKRLVKNYADWFVAHGGPDATHLDLFSQLKAAHRSAGAITMVTQLDATRSGARADLDAFVAAVTAGVPVTPAVSTQRLPFLHATKWPGFAGGDPTLRFEDKSAYMRATFPDDQLSAAYHHLTRTDYANPAALLLIAGYGGRVNAVAPDATAVAQRDSVLKLQYLAFWQDAAEDARHLAWVREFYRDVYGASGGRPRTRPGQRRLLRQLRRHRPRRPGAQHLEVALALALLQGQLPASAAGEGRLGPPRHPPARAVRRTRIGLTRPPDLRGRVHRAAAPRRHRPARPPPPARQRHDSKEKAMPFASTHGSKVEYFETGTGPGLVLVHGTGGDAGTFDNLRDTFQDRRTVVVPNYSGSGATEDEGGPLTLDLLVAQIDAAIEDSGAEGPVDLVGWSQGALAVAAYAAAHPAKVRRLVLLTGWIKNDARQQLYFDLWHRLDQLDHETFGRFLQLNGWTTAQVNSFGVAGVEEMVSGGVPAGIGRQIALNLELDITEILPRITAPTLVIGATHDNMIPVAHSRALHAAIKGSRYAELAGPLRGLREAGRTGRAGP